MLVAAEVAPPGSDRESPRHRGRTEDGTGHPPRAGSGVLCGEHRDERADRARVDALDLVILDRLLLTSTGSPSSRSTKDLDRGPPVIVLSLLSDVRSKTVGPGLGVCYRMTKPFELAELIPRARLRARTRHSAGG
jgi:DNA-binding response OmpR family regulator